MKNLERKCRFIFDFEGDPFCSKYRINLDIEPCPVDCEIYQKRLYDNIGNLISGVYGENGRKPNI